MVISTSMAPSFQVLAQNEATTETATPQQEENPIPSQEIDEDAAKYGILMRDISEFKRSVSGALNEQEQQQALDLYQQISDYRDQEYERLAEKGLSQYKRNQFDDVLEDVQQSLEPYIPPEERPSGFFGFFIDSAEPFAPLEPTTPPEFDIPNNPGGFNFPNKDIEVKSLGDILNQDQAPSADEEPILKRVSQLMVPQAKAQSTGPGLPTLADVQADDQEIIIDSSIKSLAEDLNNNPVEILNFVRNTIQFEPYYGAKKGNIGCLREQVCNDVDSSSLLISLLRAAGIPAQYKKGPIVAPVEQLQNLLGVESTKTVYAAFSWNSVPIYTVNSALTGDFESADFSNETHLALEWVSVQAYVPYDETGGNIISLLNPDDYSTDQELQDAFLDQENMLWLQIDPVFREYERTANPILSDIAQMDIPSFWTSFFSSTTTLSPLETFIADIQSATGQDLNDVNNQSFHEGMETSFDILPPAPPYTVPEAAQIPNQTITHENWSVLPSKYQFQITVSILKSSNQTVLLQQQFTGSEANNLPLNVIYEGATQADKDLITQYGGIHATPASLVNIIPLLSSDFEQFSGTGSSASIGEKLLLRFEVGYDNNIQFTDEKFSVAGNSEGIYMVTSQVQKDPSLDTNSKILLEGNPSLAREYISRVFDGDLFARALDQSWNMGFARAVVTQNRILSQVNGTPTTFTFKGLSIDATTYVNNYSNGAQYDQHSTNFRLLLGLESSFQEAQFFKDVAGLDAVSTVNGLQHAFQNPGQYNTYTIDGSNEATIDTLTLSANTKQNMHNDVQDGRTIITADRAISIGNFTGILYVSYDPATGEGRYAIGEQTQNNGGHTNNTWGIENQTQVACASSTLACENIYFTPTNNQNNQSSEQTIYDDRPGSVYGLLCRINYARYLEIINTRFESGQTAWDPIYGVPCYEKGKTFGEKYHKIVLATRGSKFYSPGDYDYWITQDNARGIIQNINHGSKDVNPSNVTFPYQKFKFNEIALTYSQYVNAPGYNYATVYYQPQNNYVGRGLIVYGSILDELVEPHYDTSCKSNCSKYEWVLNKLGYPTDNRFAINGSNELFYQNFIGGQIYLDKDIFFNDTYYIPGKLKEEYNSYGGASGSLGFPESDPERGSNNLIYQRFDNEELIWDSFQNSVTRASTIKYRCELYGDIYNPVLLRAILLHGIIDQIGSELSDIGSFVGFVVNLPKRVWSIIKEDKISKAIELLKQIEINQIINAAIELGDQAVQQLKTNYESSKCLARINYLTGKALAIAGTFVIGGKALGLIGKLNRFKFFTKALKFTGLSKLEEIGKWGKKFKVLNQLDRDELLRIRALTNSNEKGLAGEQFWRRFNNGTIFDKQTPNGTRRIDVFDERTGNAFEIKNYASGNVPLDSRIQEELTKDIYLLNNDSNYRPVWVFLDKGPTANLQKTLIENSIEFLIID